MGSRTKTGISRAVLELDMRVLLEVVVPDWVLRGAAHRRHHGVPAIVLDAHQRRLPQLARLRSDRGQNDDRASPQIPGFGAARRFVAFSLLAGPARRARRV